jgi:NTE family protein
MDHISLHSFFRRSLTLVTLALAGCSSFGTKPVVALPPITAPTPVPATVTPIKIGLALGGGAARGFAHIGVIKALEAQGIVPDIVVGTSAGALVGALYSSGFNGFELQKIALEMDESQVSDWSLPDRGVIKGEALQNFVNKMVSNRPLEKLPRRFAAVATNLKTGETTTFTSGNSGAAVRASSAVPGVFQPVQISGSDYVDGGLVSPLPISIARKLGADFVIAVDISAKPSDGKTRSTTDVMLQTFAIMGQTISRHEQKGADIVIRPITAELPAADFVGRHRAVLEGEKAAALVMPQIKAALEKKRTGL